MGLDISVYRNARKVDPQPVRKDNGQWPDEVWDSDTVIAFVPDDSMLRSLRGLEPDTVYDADYDHGFRAGSYGGYNAFRSMLAEELLGVSPYEVWNNPMSWVDKPFFELINFSDCEGTIGPEAAADLAVDFDMFQDRVQRVPDEYFRERYAEWQHAFHIAAAHHGLVDFH